jgi:hypothetical protein
VQGENGDRATEEAAEKLENLSLSCDPAADSQVYNFTFNPLDGVQSILSFLLRQLTWMMHLREIIVRTVLKTGWVNLSMAGLFKSLKRS